MYTIIRSLGLTLVVLACFVAPAKAGAIGPTVVGVVRDSSGTPLANVQVIVAEARRTITTDSEGKFAIRGLVAGEYHLTTLFVGYRPGHAVVVVPESGPDVAVTITMLASPLRLHAVSVTASPTATDPERVAQATVEVSGLALQRSLSGNIAQTLGQEPGVAVRFNGAATMPVIRGLTGDRVLVLHDGDRTADLSSSAADHATTIDPLSASRIEVVRGPASLLYGNNALGGVVNVISDDIPTAVPSHLAGSVGALAETGRPGVSMTASAATRLTDAWALNVRGGAHRSGSQRVGGGDVLANTQSRNANGTVGLGYIGQRSTAGLSLSAYDFNYGLPGAPDDDESAHIVGARMGATLRATVNTTNRRVPYLKVDATAQGYEHDEVLDDGEVGTTFKLNTQTLNGSAKTRLGRAVGSVGVQLLAKQYDAMGEEALTPAARTVGAGAFVYQEFRLGGDSSRLSPTLSVGGRFDAYTIRSRAGAPRFGPARTVDVTSPSGSIGLTLPLGASSTLSGSVAQAFRAPTVEELFSNAVHEANGDFERGNVALKAEQSRGFEAVLRTGGESVSASASAYVNTIRGYIFPDVTKDTVVDGRTMPLAVYRQRDARLTGVEGSVEYRVAERVVLGAMGDVVRGSFLGDSGPLPFMPPARIGGSARWDDGQWNVGVEARHGFSQERVTGGADVATDAFTVVNLSAGVNLIAGGRVHTVTLRIDNAGDVRYYDATSRIKEFAPNAGRNAALVYRVLF